MKNLYTFKVPYNKLIQSVFQTLNPSIFGRTPFVTSNTISVSQDASKTTAQPSIATHLPNFEAASIKLKLDKYNTELNRSLKTLEYVQLMENRTDSSIAKNHFKELFNLKETVEKEIIKAAEKINHYKFLLEAARA